MYMTHRHELKGENAGGRGKVQRISSIDDR